MKRYIAGLACAATAVLSVPVVSASTAHAQAADPVTALKSQFRSGHGVKFLDVTKMRGYGSGAVLAQREGVFRFGTSGIAASDQTAKLRIKASDLEAMSEGAGENERKGMAGLAKPERVIRIGNVSYVSGGVFGEFLPADKTWIRFPNVTLGATGTLSQLINITKPATLKALLAHATQRAGVYRGKITFGELYKVSPWFRAAAMLPPSGKHAKTVLDWKLFVGADRLPRRLTTTYSTGGAATGGMSMTVETRYVGWGSKVTVKAPPADEVAKLSELEDGADTSTTPIPLLGN